MRDFLKIAENDFGFNKYINNFTLEEMVNLPHSEEKGNITSFDINVNDKKEWEIGYLLEKYSKFIESILDTNPYLTKEQRDVYLHTNVNKFYSYFYHSLISVKAINLWKKYKKAYTIDPHFYKSLLNAEHIDINFSLMEKLPFDSFYIDLSNIPVKSTNKFQSIIGVIVNIINEEMIHLTFIDSNNIDANPINTVIDILNSESENVFPELCEINTKEVHFYEVTLCKKNAKDKMEGSAYESFGYLCLNKDEMLECSSYVITELITFTIQFLYFLHSKNEDIEVHNYHSSSPFKIHNEPVEQWDVGFKYGKTIRALEKKTSLYGDHIIFGGDKKRPRAHVRRAHYHNVWHGPKDNQYIVLHYYHETYVNGTAEDIIANFNLVTDEDLKCSFGEKIIKDYLTKCGLSFEEEYSVNIKNHLRRYDFKVNFKGKPHFIEFDGEQHFFPVEQFGGEESFKVQQIADFDKNKYAKQNDIPLLRIRFDQKEIIPKLIDSFFENPPKHRFNPVLDNKKYYQI